MEEDLETKIAKQGICVIPNQVICCYYEDKKVHSVAIDLKEDEHIVVSFEKGYVIVRTETETKFVCKGKVFISLWK